MSILTPEIPSAFGALDSDIYTDGDPSDAHVLREINRSANRLACVGEPMLRYVYDAGIDGTEGAGRFIRFGDPFWVKITPGPITRPKHPGLTRAKLFVYFRARSGETIYLQVHTTAAPFSSAATPASANVLTLTGTGADAWAELDDIPISEGSLESMAVYMLGEPTSTLGSTGTYGTPNTGGVDYIRGGGAELTDASAAWSLSPSWADGGHAVLFEDASGGNPILSARSIERVVSATQLVFYPPLETGWERFTTNGANYRIVELPQVRLYSMTVYAKDREG